MKRIVVLLGIISAVTLCTPFGSLAQDSAAPAAERTVQERLEDLEAYVNNAARSEAAAPSKVAGPGPGHNAWQMASTALVLFMTLPGLALFYGGLVRRKNVLSVMADRKSVV